MTEQKRPSRKRIIVEVMCKCKVCGCEWPDVVEDGTLRGVTCPNVGKPESPHPQFFDFMILQNPDGTIGTTHIVPWERKKGG